MDCSVTPLGHQISDLEKINKLYPSLIHFFQNKFLIDEIFTKYFKNIWNIYKKMKP